MTLSARFPAVRPKATSLSLGRIAHPARPLRGLRLKTAPGLLIRLAAPPPRTGAQQRGDPAHL